MSKFINVAAGIASRAKETASSITKGAVKIAKGAAENVGEIHDARQVERKRVAAKNTAANALTAAAKELESYNKNLAYSDIVKVATESLIEEIGRIKEVIRKNDPEIVIRLLEDQREEWLNEKSFEVDGDNYAQLELDKSEIFKRRMMAAKKCEDAINALKKNIEEREKDLEPKKEIT